MDLPNKFEMRTYCKEARESFTNTSNVVGKHVGHVCMWHEKRDTLYNYNLNGHHTQQQNPSFQEGRLLLSINAYK